MKELLETLDTPEDINSQIIFVKNQIEINSNLYKMHKPNNGTKFIQVMLMYENILKTIKGQINCNDKSLHTRVCAFCEKTFAPKSAKGRFCSSNCRVGHHRKHK